MGQTREKKPSKRNLKKAEHPLSEHIENLSITKSTDFPVESAPASSAQLSVSGPLARTSHLSLLSSAASIDLPPKHQSYDASLVEVRRTPDKGFALFATRRVLTGTLVLAEAPLIRLTDEDEREGNVDILGQRFESLPKTSQRSFLKLHDSKKEGFSKVKSKYFSNCYNLEAHRSTKGGSCIGLLASRINHSCVPNVQFSFLEDIPPHIFDDCEVEHSMTESDESGWGEVINNKHSGHNGMMLFHALKTISRGSEVLSNYDSIYATTQQRHLTQQMHYGFRCDCEACIGSTNGNDFWRRSDERRKEMINVKNEIDSSRFIESNEVLRKLEKLEQLLLKEGILGAELVQTYGDLVKWSKRAGNESAVQYWEEKQCKARSRAYGDHEQSK